jgi:hypothetical protein
MSSDGLSNWMPCVSAPTFAANTITICKGHNVTISNSVTVDEVVVASGGILELATSSSSLLTVNDGAGNDIIVQNGGVFKHNIASNSALPTFTATAVLEIQSGGILEATTNNGIPSNYANTDSLTAAHVSWSDGSVFDWNNTRSPTGGGKYFPASSAIPVFRFSKSSGIGGTLPTIINGLLEANADVFFSSTGTKTFRNGLTGTGKVTATSGSVGQFIINGVTAKLGGADTLTFSDKGLLISPNTTLTLISNKTINATNITTIGTVTSSGTIIAGDYTISGNCKVQIDSLIKTSNVNGLNGGGNTTFATGIILNPLGASSTVEYNRSGDQTVSIPPLVNSTNNFTYKNLIVSGSGIKAVASGNDITVTGMLNIMSGNTFALNGTNNLKLNNAGSVTINANATFDNGGESQITGGISQTIDLSGTFIIRDADGFTGTNTAIPGATVNIFNGSTIEYGRTGDQIVTPRNDYKNLTFSGSGVKTIPTCRPIGTVTIKDNVIADASNKTFGDTTATNLVMTGGRFRVGGTGTKPDIEGSYNLAGGVIEFTNAGATTQAIRSPQTYLNIEVSGSNVGNSRGTLTLASGGSFKVKTGGTFENSSYRIDGLTGTQTFIMEAGSTFITGVKGGFSDNDFAALKNIENYIISPKSTIIYNKGDQTITPLAAGYPTLLLKGTGNKTVASGIVTISADADSVVIDPLVVFKVNAGAKADFRNCSLFIRSNASGTGMIGEISDGPSALLNLSGVVVERFIPARRAFRFLSPSVTTSTSIKANWMEGVMNPNTTTRINPYPGYGTNITGSGGSENGFDPTKTNNSSLFTFNNSSQRWEAVTNTYGILQAGKAYRLMVRGDRSIDMTQYDNNPTPTNTILRTRGTLFTGSFAPALTTVDKGYTFIGNPYTSPVDFLKMIKMNSLKQVTGTAYNIKPEYTIWDPNLSRRGAYVTFSAVTGKSIDTSKVDQNIQPGQAFFVQTIGPDPKLQFEEIYKSTTQTRVFRDPSLRTKLSVQLLLNLNEGMENTADGVAALFDESFSDTIGNEDSHKFTNLDETMAIERNGQSLSIEGRPMITKDDTIPLKMWRYKQKNYYLKLKSSNFSPGITAFFKDNYLKEETPVDLSSVTLLPVTVDTTIAASAAEDRFSIIFKDGKILPVTITHISAYFKEHGIQVEWTTHSELNIKRYEIEKSVNGHDFDIVANVPAINRNVAIEKYNWFDANANPGSNFYRIKIVEKSGEVKYSKTVKVNVSNGEPQIIVSPNPIKGNIIRLFLQNMENGKYNINLYNSLGQIVYKGSLKHTASLLYTIIPGIALPKGVYRLSLSKEDKVINKTMIFE